MQTATMFLAAGAVLASANELRSTGDRVLKIKVPEMGKMAEGQLRGAKALFAEADVWGEDEEGRIEVRVAPNQVALFEALGLDVVDATEEKAKHLDFMAETIDSQLCRGDAKACARDDEFYDNYQTYEAIHERFQMYEDKYDSVTRKDWGLTYEGRVQRGVRIASDETTKPAIFYFCGEHSREWIPPMFCTYMAETLAEKLAENDSVVTRMMESVEFHILPIMNVDGYHHTMTQIPFNMLWRKSRQPNSGSNCIGTDLNRNYASHWNEGGSSSDPCSDTFHGRAPFDNVETANMEAYAAETDILVQTDVHAYGQMWMHPWGWTSQNGGRPSEPDYSLMNQGARATADAIRGVSGLNFRYGPISDVIYVASGSSCDHFYDKHGVVYAYAPEVRGTSFQPDASNIKPSNDELWAGMIAQVEFAINNSNSTKAF